MCTLYMYVCMYDNETGCLFRRLICMYVYIYVRMYVCMYVEQSDRELVLLSDIHVCMYACMYVLCCICMYACMNVCMYVKVRHTISERVPSCPCIHTCTCICPCIHTYTCIHACLRTSILIFWNENTYEKEHAKHKHIIHETKEWNI